MCSGLLFCVPTEMYVTLYFGVTPWGWNQSPISNWSVISSPTAW